MLEFTIGRVREMKGAALSVWVLLSQVSLPVSQAWLERNSGYSDKPVSQALAYLQETGQAVRAQSGWILASPVELAAAQAGQVEKRHPVSRNNSAPSLSSSNLLNTKELKDSTINTTKPERKISDSEREAIWAELRQLNVRRNRRTEAMVELDHVTPEYVRALAEKLADEGRGGPRNAGLFIRTCEQAEPVGNIPASVEDMVARFLSGN